MANDYSETLTLTGATVAAHNGTYTVTAGQVRGDDPVYLRGVHVTGNVGETLTVDVGVWMDQTDLTFAIQWQADGVNIADQDSVSLPASAQPAGTDVRPVITASDGTNTTTINGPATTIPAAAAFDYLFDETNGSLMRDLSGLNQVSHSDTRGSLEITDSYVMLNDRNGNEHVAIDMSSDPATDVDVWFEYTRHSTGRNVLLGYVKTGAVLADNRIVWLSNGTLSGGQSLLDIYVGGSGPTRTTLPRPADGEYIRFVVTGNTTTVYIGTPGSWGSAVATRTVSGSNFASVSSGLQISGGNTSDAAQRAQIGRIRAEVI